MTEFSAPAGTVCGPFPKTVNDAIHITGRMGMANGKWNRSHVTPLPADNQTTNISGGERSRFQCGGIDRHEAEDESRLELPLCEKYTLGLIYDRARRTMNSICLRSRAVQVALKLMSSSSGGAIGHTGTKGVRGSDRGRRRHQHEQSADQD
jgi:hypothetical protein